MGRIVSAYLDLAEERAKRRIPMTMEDWSKRLDQFLQFDERNILKGAGRISKEIAKDFAESEFEKYRIVQDRLFESDFDREIKKLEKQYSSDEMKSKTKLLPKKSSSKPKTNRRSKKKKKKIKNKKRKQTTRK